MKHKIIGLMAAIGLVISMGACGGDGTSKAAQDEGQPPSKIQRSSRGNIVKQIGEEAGISGPDGKDVATWTVTSITKDAKCTNPAAKQPEHGHYVVLDISAKTTSKYDPNEYSSLSVGEPYMWKYIQRDGTQWNGMPGSSQAAECMAETENLPHTINQGITATGKVVFDLPSTDGILVYPHPGSQSWEYSLS